MIASLTGTLKRKTLYQLVVDVAGVGYHVQAPLSTYYVLPEVGEEVSLNIYTYVREDALSLFGFQAEAEKEMFLLLLGVSGIGPRLALAVLSSLSVADISSAITSSDDTKLCTIPGIGRKTAARMVLELRDKIALLAPGAAHQGEGGPDAAEDALSALVNLGYKKSLAEEALKKARLNRPGSGLQELIKEALGVLMRR